MIGKSSLPYFLSAPELRTKLMGVPALNQLHNPFPDACSRTAFAGKSSHRLPRRRVSFAPRLKRSGSMPWRRHRARRLHGIPQRLEAALSLAYSGTTGSRALPV
jgi:hypothetical protein